MKEYHFDIRYKTCLWNLSQAISPSAATDGERKPFRNSFINKLQYVTDFFRLDSRKIGEILEIVRDTFLVFGYNFNNITDFIYNTIIIKKSYHI
jgi:hypothetical protein